MSYFSIVRKDIFEKWWGKICYSSSNTQIKGFVLFIVRKKFGGGGRIYFSVHIHINLVHKIVEEISSQTINPYLIDSFFLSHNRDGEHSLQ